VAKSRKRPRKVFLNIPYDSQFEPLFLAYISGVSAFGLVTRATLEIPSSNRRLDRILELVQGCEYSLHDLSRVELERQAPRTPRFNMPFELGLAVAHQHLSKSEHQWFVFETKKFRLDKSLSDLNGTDPFIHSGSVGGLFREICNVFRRPGRQPSIQNIREIYREMRKSLDQILREAGSESIYSARVFKDISVVASAHADRLIS
jgi:hypothetical protein